MAYQRTAIQAFSLANNAYVGASVSFYTIDGDGVATTTLATLYDATTGTGTLANPQTLDSTGKFSAPVYAEVPVIAQVSGSSVSDHSTGVIYPRLSDSDVTAAATSATNAAASETAAETAQAAAEAAQTAAEAAQTAAEAAVGTVKVTSTDTTSEVLNSQLSFSAPLSAAVQNTGANEVLAVSFDGTLLSDQTTIAATDEFFVRRASDGVMVAISETSLIAEILSPYDDVEEFIGLAQALANDS